MDIATIILCIISAGFGAVLTYFLFVTKSYEKGKMEGSYEKETSLFYAAQKAHLEGNGNNVANVHLNQKFIEGREHGRKEELQKFNITIDPFIRKEDGLFKSKATTGYKMQITYNGFPIGDPSERIVECIEKFKEDNFKLIADNLLCSIKLASGTISSQGFTVNIPEKLSEKTLRLLSK